MAKCYAITLIKVAEKEVGYLEKKSNSQLESKTANAGYNNYTKYANFFDKNYPDFYNGKKNGYAWCDMFVDWCFVQAFGKEKGRTIIYQPLKSCGAGCMESRRYYQNNGALHSSPKVGDQIFFYSSDKKQIAHTGIVYKVDSSKVYTIEGNTSSASGVVANGGAVAKKSYALSYYRIAGYGRPKYDAEKKTAAAAAKKTYSGTFPTVTASTNLKKGSKGVQVKYLQKFLNWYGNYKLDVDGDFGILTEKSVKDYQKAEGLTVDGIFGTKSLAKAKKIKK